MDKDQYNKQSEQLNEFGSMPLQALYQLIVVFGIMFFGERLFDIDSGRYAGTPSSFIQSPKKTLKDIIFFYIFLIYLEIKGFIILPNSSTSLIYIQYTIHVHIFFLKYLSPWTFLVNQFDYVSIEHSANVSNDQNYLLLYFDSHYY